MKYTFVSVTDALKSLVQMTPREHVKHAVAATNYVKEQFGALEEKATKYAQDLEVTLEELNALKDRTIDAVAKSSLMDVKVADIPDTVISTVVNEAATFFEPAKPVPTSPLGAYETPDEVVEKAVYPTESQTVITSEEATSTEAAPLKVSNEVKKKSKPIRVDPHRKQKDTDAS